MMNKVLLVGELISNNVIAKNAQGSVNAFIIATVRVPKDTRRDKEVHFLYCKAFGKSIPGVLDEAKTGDILCVSGQLATTSFTKKDGSREYRMEIWAESIKHVPDKIRERTDISNPSRLIEQAVHHYNISESLGEKYVHTLSQEKTEQKTEKEKHIEIISNIVDEKENDKDETAPDDTKKKILA
ncbi:MULTISPECIES: single-stranded DNA-binding protein [Jeotgalicoccus]|jgi:Single-stranded DNA-binding protein|uniref:Single-stranded DNA-binding protein n=1 Tax=Jeotgalicoccus nanhaiensis TaxID=568603 RepID=A0ABR9Y0K5_9STAP|nr:single-stranded DNA-binding protein [Jeotgalicoccus nanhaiensis]MBF0754771.1 single-stranded DNA-binding protein [Jeotgalicoccus nanhaiensis]TFU60777.1 single-stranded DNA-binding protein [Jeotgalicoccus nanhaiensis]